MTDQDAAGQWSPGCWSLVGARPVRSGKWAVEFTRAVGPDTTFGEVVDSLQQAHPRALEAVISVDLRRRNPTATAALYLATRQEALEALMLSRAYHPPVPNRLAPR